MTFLEAIVALVVLGLSAVGYLEVFQGSARSVRGADEWNRASAVAASVLEENVRARIEGSAPETPALPDGLKAQVDTRPYNGSGSVEDVSVTVRLADGRAMTVHRLVRRR